MLCLFQCKMFTKVKYFTCKILQYLAVYMKVLCKIFSSVWHIPCMVNLALVDLRKLGKIVPCYTLTGT